MAASHSQAMRRRCCGCGAWMQVLAVIQALIGIAAVCVQRLDQTQAYDVAGVVQRIGLNPYSRRWSHRAWRRCCRHVLLGWRSDRLSYGRRHRRGPAAARCVLFVNVFGAIIGPRSGRLRLLRHSVARQPDAVSALATRRACDGLVDAEANPPRALASTSSPAGVHMAARIRGSFRRGLRASPAANVIGARKACRRRVAGTSGPALRRCGSCIRGNQSHRFRPALSPTTASRVPVMLHQRPPRAGGRARGGATTGAVDRYTSTSTRQLSAAVVEGSESSGTSTSTWCATECPLASMREQLPG